MFPFAYRNNGQLGRRDSQGNSGQPGGRRDSQSNNAQPGGRKDSLSNNGQLGRRDMPGNSRAGAQDNNMRTGLNRQNSQNNTGAGKRELGPVREGNATWIWNPPLVQQVWIWHIKPMFPDKMIAGIFLSLNLIQWKSVYLEWKKG